MGQCVSSAGLKLGQDIDDGMSRILLRPDKQDQVDIYLQKILEKVKFQVSFAVNLSLIVPQASNFQIYEALLITKTNAENT